MEWVLPDQQLHLAFSFKIESRKRAGHHSAKSECTSCRFQIPFCFDKALLISCSVSPNSQALPKMKDHFNQLSTFWLRGMSSFRILRICWWRSLPNISIALSLIPEIFSLKLREFPDLPLGLEKL